jgi:hypothetical protein
MKRFLSLLLLVLSVSGFSAVNPCPPARGLDGTWKLIPEKSTDLATWRSRVLRLSISTEPGQVLVLHQWLERDQVVYADTFQFIPGGKPVSSRVGSELWPENWFMGVLSVQGGTRTVTGSWEKPDSLLLVHAVTPVRTSQGLTEVRTSRQYRLAPDGTTLTLTEQRSGRPTPIVLTFERMTGTTP